MGFLDLLQLGLHEEGDLDPGVLERLHHRPDLDAVQHDVEPALGRQLLAPLRHERHLVGLHGEGDAQHLLAGRHRQLETRANRLAQHLHVAVLDVPPVGPQVDRDRRGAAELGQHGRVDGVRLLGAPRLTDRHDVIDVDRQGGHGA